MRAQESLGKGHEREGLGFRASPFQCMVFFWLAQRPPLFKIYWGAAFG